MRHPMTAENQAQLQQNIDAIADTLCRNTPAEQLATLPDIEQAIRQQAQTWVWQRATF